MKKQEKTGTVVNLVIPMEYEAHRAFKRMALDMEMPMAQLVKDAIFKMMAKHEKRC